MGRVVLKTMIRMLAAQWSALQMSELVRGGPKRDNTLFKFKGRQEVETGMAEES